MDELLTCTALSKQFSEKTALDGAELHLQSGRIIGLLGPNGSGKSTLLKLANGLLTPDEGEVRILGRKPCAATKALVSYMPDRPVLPERMSVKDLCGFWRDFYADFRTETAEALLKQYHIDTNERFCDLSKGGQQKVSLILTMSRAARLYLLDEPLGGIDPAARESILQTILRTYNPDASILIATHLIADVEPLLDEVVLLKEHRVLAHRTADEIRESEGMSIDTYFKEVYQC